MAWDGVWDEVFRERPWGKYPGEELIRFVAGAFYSAADRGAVKLLEVGCGPGANLWYMAREGFQVYGVDGSEHAVTLAKRRLDEECAGWRGEVRCGDVVNLPYAEGSFDGVIDNAAICCNPFDDAVRIYAEMARVLKPGGRLFSRTFATGSWGDGSGTRLGHNAYLVDEGPTLGMGCTRFTALEEIEVLLGETLELESVERLSRTLDRREHEIKEWIIRANKPC